MSIKVTCLVLITSFFCSCNSKDTARVSVKLVNTDSTFKIEDRPLSDFVISFSDFYKDKNGQLFVKTFGHRRSDSGKMELVDVFVQVPQFDPATFKVEGQYLLDSSKVVCSFENSDGGSYKILKSADPQSFQSFSGIFGGKDKYHVFFQDKVLSGVKPDDVKIYSEQKICGNCLGYVKGDSILYFGSGPIPENNFQIPDRYKYIQ
jgi:hypothetical protein